MIKKAKALFALFQAGKIVADPVKWKTRQISTTVITSLIWVSIETVRAFGYEVPVSAEVIDASAIIILAVVNGLLTVTTTDKLGLPSPNKRDC